VRVVALALALLALAGCGLQPDDLPRDIAEDQRGDLSEVVSGGDDSPVGGRRIFLVSADSTGSTSLLRSVPRDVGSSPTEVLTALLAGPTITEQATRLRSAIPQGTFLVDVEFVAQGTLQVDLSSAIFDATGDSLIDAVAQVIYTANEIEGVDQVLLRVDGQPQQWPRGDGALVNGPLTIYDYPGRAVTTQPDFPAVPTPVA
jgi:spore germination protein GerM